LKQLWRLVTGFLTHWPGIKTKPGLVEFVMDEVTLGRVRLRLPFYFSVYRLLFFL
jgi:hypothetical protein